MVTHWLSFMYLYLMASLLCDLDCADEWFVCLVGLVDCGLVDIEYDVLRLFVWCLVGELLGGLLVSLVFVVLGGFCWLVAGVGLRVFGLELLAICLGLG